VAMSMDVTFGSLNFKGGPADTTGTRVFGALQPVFMATLTHGMQCETTSVVAQAGSTSGSISHLT